MIVYIQVNGKRVTVEEVAPDVYYFDGIPLADWINSLDPLTVSQLAAIGRQATEDALTGNKTNYTQMFYRLQASKNN